MRKIIKSLVVVFVVIAAFSSPKMVVAQQCANWLCRDDPCTAPDPRCPIYSGFVQTCWCDEGTNCQVPFPPPDCVSCTPGYYVCNSGCCPIGDPPGSGGQVCGDSSCDGTETCATCAADCGACASVTADVKANGSDVDITTAAPYTVSWSTTNADLCLLNRAQVGTAGSIPYSNTTGTYPYNLSCTNATTQDTDSVNVTVDCSILTADVKANGSDTDITTYDPYTISWSSANATSCTLNGGAVALSGSQVEPASTEGTYPYALLCSTSVCSDNDSVNAIVNFCGNGSCAGFENCSVCAVDCGGCPTAWWQVAGGNLFSSITSGNAIISDIAAALTCIEPACVPGLSIRDRSSASNSDGFPVTGGGAISINGEMITYRDPDVFALGTVQTRFYETYSYFYSKLSLGLLPADDYNISAGDALEPSVSQEFYFHSGNMTIQSAWDVTSGESYVVFVDGDLTIEDPGAVGELIKVAEGGFLAFIVSGDINIADSVGHSVLTNTAGNVEGVYIADGTITVASNGSADNRFVGEGTFVGWTSVSLERTFDELTANNDLYPVETFVYRPDLLKNTPEKMKRAQMLWQETN